MQVTGPTSDKPKDLSIGKAWKTSMMALSTRDPYWHAVVADEIHRYPELSDPINEKCTICHAPMARDWSSRDSFTWQLYDSGSKEKGDFVQGVYSMDSSSELFNHAMEGVSCSLCHQLEGTNFGTPEGMSGNFTVVGSPTGERKDRPAYGQYQNPTSGYMIDKAEFTPQYGSHLGQSESCATCHNLDVAGFDKEGQPLDVAHFSEQAVFYEWQNSDFAVGGSQEASCQDCHMPTAEEPTYLSNSSGPLRENFREHTFLGSNTIMQSMIRDFAVELGVRPENHNPGLDVTTDEDFNESIARNRAFLETSAALSVENGGVQDDKLKFDVIVTNLTGHKLPSAYHSRRAWLHVQVLDASNNVVFESGAMEADGKIIGVSEDVNPATWEAHYDRITSPTQVQVYQTIVGNSENERTHSLLNVSHYLKDNRLLPAGYDKMAVQADNTLPETFGVFGAALEDDDFIGGSDTVSYEVSVDGTGSYTVLVELRYQPFSFGHLMELFTRSDKVEQIDMFRTIYDRTTLRAETITTARAQIQ